MTFRLADGRTVTSEPAIARGNPENPLTAEELTTKSRALAWPVLGEYRSSLIEAEVASLGEADAEFDGLMDDLIEPAEFFQPQHSAE